MPKIHISSLEDAQRVFGPLDMWTKAWTDCDGIIRYAEREDMIASTTLCHITRWGTLDMWTGAWTDCDGVIQWAEGRGAEAFKVSHEIEEEEEEITNELVETKTQFDVKVST